VNDRAPISLLLLPAAAAALLLLSACGSSEPSSTDVATSHIQAARTVPRVPRPLGSGVNVVNAGHTRNIDSGAVSTSRRRPIRARAQAGMIDDEVNASGAKPVQPCTLVSRSDAQAILGKPVDEPVTAPQGPTCIYKQPAGEPRVLTLAVESLDFSTVKPQSRLRDRMSVTVDRHAAYCGVTGTPTMIVPLTAGRFLDIAAPCPIAAAFASRALSHLAG
jgi:hypothetical protein